MKTAALVATVSMASAATAARVQSTEYTFLGDLLPTYTKSLGYAPYQVNKRWYENGFNQYVMQDGKKVVRHFAHGVFTHAPADVQYHLEGKYSQFSACVGLDAYAGANVASCASHDGVVFKVAVDGKPVWSVKKRMGEVRTCFNIALEVVDPSKNAQTLSLGVDKLQNSDCDEAEWTDAKLFEDPVVDCQQLGSLVPSFTSVGWGSYWVNRRWHMNGFEIAGAKYSSGVFAHAPSRIIYPLHGKFDTFSTCVGLDDGVKEDNYSSKDCGEVAFKVMVDGKQQSLGSHGAEVVMKGQQPVECFAVKVTGAKRLELVVDHMQDSKCDESEWVNANVCREAPKSIDCQVSSFTEWNACSKTCGTGYQTRTRTETKAAAWGGKSCPTLQETRACQTESCPIDCIESKWSEWVQCSATCGGGSSFRYRSEDRSSAFGGKGCGVLQEKKVCNTLKCPIDCQVTDWSNWDACSLECGGGYQWQRRTVIVSDSNNGKGCPVLSQKRLCNDHPCRIDCDMTDWSTWSDCSVKCGGGTQKRTRTMTRMSQHGGKSCPPDREDRACNISECPIDCELSQWGDFPDCSSTCGGGRQTRYRSIEVTSAFGGSACEALTDPQTCNKAACPVDCLMGSWGPWQKCDKACGGGQEQRFRNIDTDALEGGKKCGDTSQSRPCNVHECPVDCDDKGFGAWETCTKSCGNGVQVRRRTVIQAKYGGKACPPLQMRQEQSCNTQGCPLDCKVSSWSPWSTCDKLCGSGTMWRTRAHLNDPAFGGKTCPGLRQERKCNKHACAVDCVLTPFTPWSKCDRDCGGGKQSRTAEITTAAQHGGRCPALKQTRSCNTNACPLDCLVSGWSAPSACSTTCADKVDLGRVTHQRFIRRQPLNGGKACPPLFEQRACSGVRPKCPVNCKVGPWSAFGKCSNDCGGGVATSTREITTAPENNGTACPSELKRTQPCNARPCPINCIVTDFSNWSTCSRSCGRGVSTRKRDIVSRGKNGGVLADNACPARVEVRECEMKKCPVHCELSQWGSFTECSKSCGNGFHFREREITTMPSDGGAGCPSIKDVRFCATRPCSDFETPTWQPYVRTAEQVVISDNAPGSDYQDHLGRLAPTPAPTVRVFLPTPAPTVYVAKKDCQLSPTRTVAHGWAGAGYGDQFCNLVRCDDGVLKGENARNCLAPFRHRGTKCTTITCKFQYSYEAKRELMKVTHENGAGSEQEGNHHCAYNMATGKCRCRCYQSSDAAGRPVILQWGADTGAESAE